MLDNDITLRKNKEFGYVFRAGKKQVGRFMVIYAARNGIPKNRYGIITSKKVGNAVARNRAKRRLRDFVRRIDERLKPGFDIVIIARFSINDAGFSEIVTEGEQLLKRVGL
ncbi:MAG: ribonuclease P protein component [Syntrophomonadales bacterium]|jgi:ribonuclease P protein component